MFKRHLLALSALILLAFASNASAQETIEKIFFNGIIFTADVAKPETEAFAVSDGKIVAIGTQEEVLAMKQPETELVDLGGNRVLPGLIDAHSHAIFAGLAELSPNFRDEVLELDVLNEKIAAWVKNGDYSSDRPLVIFGVNPDIWKNPHALSLVFDVDFWSSQPLLLLGSDYHTAWVNAAMRDRAGISKEYSRSLNKAQIHTIGLDDEGKPNGILVDAGLDRVMLQLPKPEKSQLFEAGKIAVSINNKYGITAWMDPAANAGPGEALFSRAHGNVGTGILPAYRALAENNLLSAHVAALLVASPQSDEADLEHLETVQKQFADVKNLTLPGIKVFADGVLEFPAQSAALLGTYNNSGKQGELLFEDNNLASLVDAIDNRGWIVHIHALGDRAVRQSLDALEQARKNRDSGINHSITHLQLVEPSDYRRFAELNIIPVMQLHWAEVDNYLLDLVKPYISEEEYNGQYPAKSLQQHGAVIAGASDWPISTNNPWEAMHNAMTRSGPEGGLNPEERLDLKTMLLAYTLNAAKAIGLEDEIGSISLGKQADFIVLDRDVLAVDVEELKNTNVLETYFGGQKVYSMQ